MIATMDFKKGKKILFNNAPYMILEYISVKPGKGGAYIRTKMKNMITGLIHEETFRSGEKFEDPNLEYKDMQYLYEQDGLYHFMDLDSYEQYSFSKDQIEEAFDYLKEQEIYNIIYFQEKPLAVTPPMFMQLKVASCPPGVRGNSAQGGVNKPCTMETGIVIQAPLFVAEGDTLKVDTRTNEYIERVSK
ncbi:elongation factor P [Candidatus Babeliales bacterium]|nr:elongation factor P [Candidatus Babeliales bacterium]